MGQAELQPRHYTVEEYLELEEHSEVRHEFYEGEVFAMAGGSLRHSMLVGNCFALLKAGLRGQKCRVYSENAQLAVKEGEYYNYPDVIVTCAPADLRAERTLKEPTLLIEVLSKSTEGRDRTWKFNQYKRLPSLRHYLLVSQTTCAVEWYRREANDVWSFTPLLQFTDEISFPELGIILTLNDIYEDTGVVQMAAYPGGKASNGQASEEVAEND